MRTDEVIKRDIVEQMYWDDRVDASDVHPDIDNGTVTLTGTVPTYRAKMAAEDSAWVIEGVSSVLNQLRVEYPRVLALPTDEDIAKRVVDALERNVNIDDVEDITVSVRNGIVKLTGPVPSYTAKRSAYNSAFFTTGVLSVDDQTAVIPEYEPQVL